MADADVPARLDSQRLLLRVFWVLKMWSKKGLDSTVRTPYIHQFITFPKSQNPIAIGGTWGISFCPFFQRLDHSFFHLCISSLLLLLDRPILSQGLALLSQNSWGWEYNGYMMVVGIIFKPSCIRKSTLFWYNLKSIV